jgi:hypothetical protein
VKREKCGIGFQPVFEIQTINRSALARGLEGTLNIDAKQHSPKQLSN